MRRGVPAFFAALAAAVVLAAQLTTTGTLGAHATHTPEQASHNQASHNRASHNRASHSQPAQPPPGEQQVITVMTATDDAPAAVDVDLAPADGVWLTYPDGHVRRMTWGDVIQAGVRPVRNTTTAAPAPGLAEGETAVELLVAPVGLWVVTSLGRVIATDGATHHGDMAGVELNEPVVDAAVTASGEGYLMLAADGGVFTFGDARFHGSVQGIVDETLGDGHLAADHLTAPIVTLATTGAGYWLVAGDGAVFPFGDARYFGSFQDIVNTANHLAGITRDWTITPPVAEGRQTARDALDAPVISVVPSVGRDGYMMLATDGGIFTYGNTRFLGSFAHRGLPPAVAIDVADAGTGYAVLTADGNTHLVGNTHPAANADRTATADDPSTSDEVDDDDRDSSTTRSAGAPRGTSRTPRPSAGPRTGAVRTPTGTTTTLPTSASGWRPSSAVTQHAAACRPGGSDGFPVFTHVDLTDSQQMDVLVVFMEFEGYVNDNSVWPMSALREELRLTETYIEAQSYGRVDVDLTVIDEWLTADQQLWEVFAAAPVGDGHSATVLRAGWQATQAVKSARGDDFFTARAEPFDSILVVLPPALFANGLAQSVHIPTEDTLYTFSDGNLHLRPRNDASPRSVSMVGGWLHPSEDIETTRVPWHWIAGHELLHNLGTNDYYNYEHFGRENPNSHLNQPLLHGHFGRMGLEGFWNWPPAANPNGFWSVDRAAYTAEGTIDPADVYMSSRTYADEMLAWARWRLGWLDRVACLDAGVSGVTLSPIAAPSDGTAAAMVPLTDDQMLVLEVRRRVGSDADQPVNTGARGAPTYERLLADEGVLVYLVDTSVASGQLPISLLGDDGTGLLAAQPLVRVGERVSLATVAQGPSIDIEVVDDNPDGTFEVIIDYRSAAETDDTYFFEVERGRVTPRTPPEPPSSGSTTSTTSSTTSTTVPEPTPSTTPPELPPPPPPTEPPPTEPTVPPPPPAPPEPPATPPPGTTSSTTSSTTSTTEPPDPPPPTVPEPPPTEPPPPEPPSGTTSSTSSSTTSTTVPEPPPPPEPPPNEPPPPPPPSTTTTAPSTTTTEPPPPEPPTEPPPTQDSPTTTVPPSRPLLAADASACRPEGPAGFPLRQPAELSQVADGTDGVLDVLVMFGEFGNAQSGTTFAQRDSAKAALRESADYIEAMSYGRLGVRLTFVDGWIEIAQSYSSVTQRANDQDRIDPTLLKRRLETLPSSSGFDATTLAGRYDTLLLITPPEHFYPSAVGGTFSTDTSIAFAASLNANSLVVFGGTHNTWGGANPSRLSESALLSSLNESVSRELLRRLGITDLSETRVPRTQVRASWAELNQGRVRRIAVGPMGLYGYWSISGESLDYQAGQTAYPQNGPPVTNQRIHNTNRVDTLEMLGWSRWRAGWFDLDEVICVSGDTTTSFDLAPVAAPGQGVGLALMPLGDGTYLALEARRRSGYDADTQETWTQDDQWTRHVASEGVLAYIVDPRVESGHLPIKLLGDDGTSRLTRSPIYLVGETISVGGTQQQPAVQLDVTSDDGTAFRVVLREPPASQPPSTTPTEPAPTTPPNVGEPPPTEPVVQDISACRPAGPEGFPPAGRADLSDDGQMNVLVVFLEPKGSLNDDKLWPMEDLLEQLRITESYIETQSHDHIDIDFTVIEEWLPARWRDSQMFDIDDSLWPDPVARPAVIAGDAAGAAKVARGDDFFTSRTEQFDSMLVVLPPAAFYGGASLGHHVPTEHRTELTVNGLLRPENAASVRSAAIVGGFWLPHTDLETTQVPWHFDAGRQLLHNLGLSDYYAYPSAQAGRVNRAGYTPNQYYVGDFGRMGLGAVWPWSNPIGLPGSWVDDTADTAAGPQPANVYIEKEPSAGEMLGWARWRLGWFEDADVACLDAGASALTLDPVAQAPDGTSLAMLPLTDNQMLVLETRRRVGADADHLLREVTGGGDQYLRVLPTEGVLAYVVDTRVASGAVPISVLGDDGTGFTEHNPVVGAGEGFTMTGDDDGPTIRVEVTDENPDGSFDITVHYQAATTTVTEDAYTFDVERRQNGIVVTAKTPSPQVVGEQPSEPGAS